jgi:hypothetical protein
MERREAVLTRRALAGAAAAAALGGAAWGRAVPAAEPAPALLPTVRWGRHEITRLLVGHNPIKGISHVSEALSREMREYFAADAGRGLALLRRCEESGLNACQMGFRPQEAYIEEMLRAHYAAGGRLKWIATFYALPQNAQEAREELARLLRMAPPPIGIQQLGNTSDLLMRQGKIDLARENLKRFRDAGLLAGLGSHNHEVIDHAESNGWDVDFYQCCFYRSAFSLDPAHAGQERFEDADREAMVRTIRRVSKPCIAFKVLAAGRHCGSPEALEAALRFAFEHLKPTDVVLVGLWQKYKDQVAENAGLVRKILAASRPQT